MRERRESEVLDRLERARRRPPRFDDERIVMSHGAGGKASRALVEGLMVPAFDNPVLASLADAAVLPVSGVPLAITTDAFVVHPRRFPGGSIGDLAVNGTINDLAVTGARPTAMTAAFVLEEGLPAEELRGEVEALAAAALSGGVPVVAGDTKVVERGKADGLYIVATGIGTVDARADLGPDRLRPGDRVLVSGPVGDHGTAVMLARADLDIQAEVESDTRSLWPVVAALLERCGHGLRCMRDATRGGVATVLNEIALTAELGVVIDESEVPVRPAVAGVCELLGIDPLHVANEGTLVAFVAPDVAGAAVDSVREVGAGGAVLIGEVVEEPPGRVLARTGFGGHRMLDMLVGDPLPRIC